MAPLTETEEQTLVQQVLDQLASSSYACSALAKLGGGTANFLYRGTLKEPLLDGGDNTSTVIVKVSTGFVATNKDFPLDVSRCEFEKSMLSALDGFPKAISTSGGHVIVKAPKIFSFDEKTHTQVLQDFADTADVTTILESPSVNETLPGSGPVSLGLSVGSWLRMFHNWTAEPAQSALASQVGANEGMRKLKCLITYDSFIEILERHPEVIEGTMDILKEVQATMQNEFNGPQPTEQDGGVRGLIHGDFWGGNILLPSGPWTESRDPAKPTEIFVIDWENVQFGHRAVDVGGLLADLYERNHFKGVEASIPAMKGFIEGYGPLSEDLAYRVAVHTGVHLICWYYRRNRNAPLPHPLPKVLAALSIGRDLIVKGWTKDKTWLQTSIIGSMFADENLLK
ncbi:kinase-like domain-containing protein [Nemania sp. FL0031]|nr:kinase-like domain-containing protein [Nemania sp. FL0031]